MASSNVVVVAMAMAMAMAALLLSRPPVEAARGAEKPPKPISLSFPPFSSSNLKCQYDTSVNLTPEFICVPSRSPPGQILLSNDDNVISVRYQYKKKVQLWKKSSAYAASFSTQYTLDIDKDIESVKDGVFGGGIAFAITPTLDVDDSGPESFGLFKIHDDSGNPAADNPHTVAVEIDTSRDITYSWDPPIPHVGLDINSVNSVASRFLWNGTEFINRKIGVFIDYDAGQEIMSVRFQNVSAHGKADKKKSKLFLSYPGLNLAEYVKEQSYIGFSSRVPVTTDGVYILYDWTFSTKWVLKKDKPIQH